MSTLYTIVNPVTNRKVRLTGTLGQHILNQYVQVAGGKPIFNPYEPELDAHQYGKNIGANWGNIG
jgi:hypothetical protein